MFSKKPHGDVKKSSQKVLDPRKDALTRLKHLRVVLENTEPPETKIFFEQFYSHIYNVFYDNFIAVEASLRQRVQKRDKEELDIVLHILEKIFLYLPDLIHSGWQFHSIGQIMKKLVHVGNTYKLRLEGMRLFLLWYQALQENAVDECHLIYATLVQGFPVPVGIKGSALEYTMTQTPRPANSSDCPITEIEVAPVIQSQPGDKTPVDITKSMLEKLLELTVSQGIRMEWQNPNRIQDSFIFLLDNFRKYYLSHIFPEFSHGTSLYEPVLDIPSNRSNNSPRHWSTVEKSPMLACRVSVVQWVVSFITVKNIHNKVASVSSTTSEVNEPDSAAPNPPSTKKTSVESNPFKKLGPATKKTSVESNPFKKLGPPTKKTSVESNPFKKLGLDLSAFRKVAEPQAAVDEDEGSPENSTFPRRRLNHSLSRPSLTSLWDLASPEIRPDTAGPPQITIEAASPTVKQKFVVQFNVGGDEVIPRRLERSNSFDDITSRRLSDDMTKSRRGLRKSPSFAGALFAPMRKLTRKFGNQGGSMDAPDSVFEDEDEEETVAIPPVMTGSRRGTVELPNKRDGRVFMDPSLLYSFKGSMDDMFISPELARRRLVKSAPLPLGRIKSLQMADILECQPNGWSEAQDPNRDSLERNIDAPLIQDSEMPTISPSNTLSYKDQIMPGIVPGVISGEELELMEAARDMVQNVLYSTRDNVNFVHEILRQGFLLPMSEATAVKKALKVYSDWIQLTESKPDFMKEPSECIAAHLIGQKARSSTSATENGSIATVTLESSTTNSEVTEPDSPTAEEPETADDKAHLLQGRTNSVERMAPFQMEAAHKPRRSNSYIGAINQAIKDDLGKCNVGAGLQATVQVFITHSANVFLLEPASHPSTLVRDHVDICKRVLRLFKHIVMNVKMEMRTWEQLLMVLLRVTEGVLGGNPSRPKMALGQQLAQNLFQTLIVTWIKANLEILVSSDLWDNFLRVLSSLTHWEELIREWSRTMETLTRVLAKRVYTLDLNNLPLDRISGNRRERGKKVPPNRHSPMKKPSHERTFSRGWERSDSSSPRGGDDASKDDRNRNNTVGSRDDLDRLKQRVPYMRAVSSRAEAAEMISKMRHGGNKPLPLSMSQPALIRSTSEFNDDVIPEHEEFRNKMDITRSSSLGDLCERVEPLQQRLKGNSNVSSSAENLLGGDKEEDIEEEEEEEEPRDEDTKSRELQMADIMGQDSISIDSSEVTTPDVNRVPPSHDNNNRLTPTSLTDLYNADQSHSNPPSPGVFDPGTVSYMKSPCEENIRIEDRIEAVMNGVNIHNVDASVISGGTRTGWLPEVAVVVWRRILGSLGDINEITKPRLHAAVMECLWTIWQMLAKIRDNLGITLDNQTTPPPPDYIPPLRMLSPWLFKATDLPNSYQSGRLSAYKLLCSMTVRKQDHPLPKDHLIHFYRALHFGLVGTDQEVINTIIQYSGPEFFACDLPGSTMLILDFIHAGNMIASSSSKLEAPRIEALSLLGSLVCFPNMFCNMSVLQPSNNELSMMQCKDVKDHLASVLIKLGKKEPNCEARCIALCSLGIFLYEELVHVTYHQRMKEAIQILLASLKCENKSVAQVACDMLLLLCDHAERLRRPLPDVPKKIIEAMANTITSLLHGVESADHEDDKKLVVSLLFCVLEWCMALPLCALLETVESKTNQKERILLEIVFQVLQTAAEGIPVSHGFTSSESTNDDDVNIDDNSTTSESTRLKSPTQPEIPDQSFLDDEHFGTQPAAPTPNPSSSIIRLAAKTVRCHLINHLNHFPLGGGPASVTSLLNEFDDQSGFDMEEMSSAIFESPNIQFFIFNDNSIVSVVQIPSKPGEDLSGGLTTANSHVRTVVRSMSGKFAWDASLLYGPAEYRVDTSAGLVEKFNSASSSASSSPSHSKKGSLLDIRIVSKSRRTMPSYRDDSENDVLDELSQYIGYTSPEVLLRPGIKLNLPSPAPEEITDQIEKSVMTSLLRQHNMEDDYFHQNRNEASLISQELHQIPHEEPESCFYLCRQLLSQLGAMTWDKRCEIDIVKKNEQFARELKNLDQRQCRETHKIAVLYVAEGQEDKNSVLSNSRGSPAFENFIAGLAWEVDLSTHTGFLGGLHRNKSTGDTAPYFSTSTVEVIFHVSTRMPTEQNNIQKMRHLGNDEVHIVWSEHHRDYRRGIIATEFGDVIIVIYPLHNQLFRIQIQRKPEVPFFGPLFDGAIVDHKVLPGLVRATAINASRIKRSLLPLYEQYFEERSKYLETIVKNHREPCTFEAFSAHVYEPLLAKQYNTAAVSSDSELSPTDWEMPLALPLDMDEGSTVPLAVSKSEKKKKSRVLSGPSFRKQHSLGSQIGMPAKPHLGGDSFTTLSSSSTMGHSTSALDTQSHIPLSKQLSNKASTIPSSNAINIPGVGNAISGGMGGGVSAGGSVGSGGVTRPTRLTQPEKLLQLAATTQLGRLADKYSPHGQSNSNNKKGDNYHQYQQQGSQSSSASTTPVDNPSQLPIIGKPRNKPKRQSSTTSDHTITPPDSPDARKK